MNRPPLSVTHPELAKEALFDASTVVAGTHQKLPWRCSEGHEWEAVVQSRVAGTGCPFCSNRRVLLGFNDLATTSPHLAAEALFDATKVSAGSHMTGEWRCELGHKWQAKIVKRSKGTGCPFCANKQVLSGFNDLATTHPKLASEALFDATKVIAGTHAKEVWRCADGHEWEASPNSRVRGRGCPFCVNKQVLSGFNDLATTHPVLASEALFDATTVTAGSDTKGMWRCAEGHEWAIAPKKRASQGQGCPVCANKRVLPGFNDLATSNPELAAEALFDATQMTAGSKTKGLWRCAEGHEWEAGIGSRLTGRGCPSCASTGYDPAKPGWIYLMHHPIWELLQVGITNNIEQRMKNHTRRGWEPLDARGPMPGDAARVWELSILNHLKSRKITLTASTSHSDPDKDNSTSLGEAWWASDYPVKSLSTLMEAVREGEWRDT